MKLSKHAVRRANAKYRARYYKRWKNKDPRAFKKHKKCSDCAKRLATSKFDINRANPDGLDYRCKTCHYTYEKYIRAEDPRKQLVYGARNRASKFGLAFNLVRSDIVIPSVCPVLGIKLAQGKGKLHSGSPTIDRTDSNKGYTKDNVQVISHRANTLKSNGTIAELEKVLEYLKHVDSACK